MAGCAVAIAVFVAVCFSPAAQADRVNDRVKRRDVIEATLANIEDEAAHTYYAAQRAYLQVLSASIEAKFADVDEVHSDLQVQVSDLRVSEFFPPAQEQFYQPHVSAVERTVASWFDGRPVDAQARSLESEARRVQERATRQAAEAEMNRLSEALNSVAETRRNDVGLVVSLDEGSLVVDFDRAYLGPDAREVLSRIAGFLHASEDLVITITGHTDGSDQDSQRLSERRAQAVADYLIGASGLASERFTVEGLGNAFPLDPGDSDEARARNRRVELSIRPHLPT